MSFGPTRRSRGSREALPQQQWIGTLSSTRYRDRQSQAARSILATPLPPRRPVAQGTGARSSSVGRGNVRESAPSPNQPSIFASRHTFTEDDVCPICLEVSAPDGSPVVQLSCKHVFHETCIRKNFATIASSNHACKCPMCRKEQSPEVCQPIGRQSRTSSRPPPTAAWPEVPAAAQPPPHATVSQVFQEPAAALAAARLPLPSLTT